MTCAEMLAVLAREMEQGHGDAEVEIFTAIGFSRKSFRWHVGSIARDVNTGVIVIDGYINLKVRDGGQS